MILQAVAHCVAARVGDARVEHTAIGDTFMTHITALSRLKHLNIDGTKVTNASTNTITAFPSLKYFSGWETGLDDAALQRIDEVTKANEAAAWKLIVGSTGAAAQDEL